MQDSVEECVGAREAKTTLGGRGRRHVDPGGSGMRPPAAARETRKLMAPSKNRPSRMDPRDRHEEANLSVIEVREPA